MEYLPIKVTAQSPLSIRSDHASSGSEMTNYIPGTTLLGSLAITYRLMYPEDSTNFERLFLSGAVSFPNLYLASYKDDEKLLNMDTDLPIYPTPKTALTCKRHGGFQYPQSFDNASHGVRDTLIARALFNEWSAKNESSTKGNLKGKIAALDALKEIQKCPFKYNQHEICGEPVDHYDRYYRRIAAQKLLVSDSYKHLQTHTGINRSSGTVEEGILYNRQVFDEGTQFWGLMKIRDQGLRLPLNDFLDEIGDMGIARLGTGRTRGMGKVLFLAEESAERPDNFSDFQQRLNAFHNLLQAEANKYQSQLPAIKDSYYFALTLHSPTILTDEMLRYRGMICGRTLEKLISAQTKIEIKELQQVYQQASLRRITGWQELWGTPRTNEYAIETGSVFLFKCSLAQRESLQAALYQLEEQGIGKRQVEGFGRICISDAFHQEVTWL